MFISNPLVSIIIPTYNRPQLLKRAISSVINQTYPNIEIIVVDDASSEAIKPIIESFNNNNIKYIRHAQNKGLSASRNTGAKASQGEYINFLDDDDEIDSTKIEEQIRLFLVSPQLGLIYCGSRYVYQDKILKEHLPKHRGNVYSDSLENSLKIVIHCALIRKISFFNIDGFDVTLKSAEDWDLWIRFTKLYQIDYIPKVLVTYHFHDLGNMTQSLPDRILVRENIIRKHHTDLKKNTKALSIHQCRIGALYYMHGNYPKSRQLILNSILLWPLNWKGYTYFLLMFIDLFKKGTLESFGTFNYGKNRLYY